MSKYARLFAAMGGNPDYRDVSKTGRIFKWYSKTTGMTLADRKMEAINIEQGLRKIGVPHIQKVNIRNATASSFNGLRAITFNDYDKICVYIDKY